MARRRTFSGSKLRARRRAAGLSLRTLGRKLDTEYTSISKWENGHRSPKPPTLLLLVDMLGCEVSDLFEAVNE
ncbi:helix-turn-helix transcriptional regulator [Micromonospora sp. NPDC023814]|uniref:helix-turn-helix domain-containing protein n=1 Tax=Micromonospora sp. NPDC023814 TaxID=3154596 RepID=UPI0033FE9F69